MFVKLCKYLILLGLFEVGKERGEGYKAIRFQDVGVLKKPSFACHIVTRSGRTLC